MFWLWNNLNGCLGSIDLDLWRATYTATCEPTPFPKAHPSPPYVFLTLDALTRFFRVFEPIASRLSVRVFSVNFLWTSNAHERRTITQPRCELMWRHKRHMININRSFRHSLRLLKNDYCYRRTARARKYKYVFWYVFRLSSLTTERHKNSTNRTRRRKKNINNNT